MSTDVKFIFLTALGTIAGLVVIHLIERHVELVGSTHHAGGK